MWAGHVLPVPWRVHAMLSSKATGRVMVLQVLQAYQGISEHGAPDTTSCGAHTNSPLFLAVLH